MNVYDSARMADVLAPLGYGLTQAPEGADMMILNTCHIREKAAEKVFSELGRLRAIKTAREADGEDCVIAVAGCVAQAEGGEIMRRAPWVDMVFGPQTYHRLPEMVARATRAASGNGRECVLDTDFPAEAKFDFLPEEAAPQGPTAFLTIQEGCDKFCTFCVVPYTRGPESHRPPGQIVDEVRRLADAGVEPQVLAATAAQHAAARAETDDAVAAFLASAAEIHAEGWCTLDPAQLARTETETARRALARILVTIGGRRYAPRGAKLDRVWAELARGPLSGARTLGGCRIVPWQKTLLICREPAAAREQISVTNPGKIRWDNRFALTLSGQSARKANAFTIARLGRAGWSAVASDAPALRQTAIPPPVRPSLPTLWSGETVIAVPHLGYRCFGAGTPPMALEIPVFAPVLPLTKARFGVAK